MIAADDAKVLAYQLLHGGEERLAPDVQQSFVDARREPDAEVEEQVEPPATNDSVPITQETDVSVLPDISNQGMSSEERKRRLIELDRSFPGDAAKRGRQLQERDLLDTGSVPTESRASDLLPTESRGREATTTETVDTLDTETQVPHRGRRLAPADQRRRSRSRNWEQNLKFDPEQQSLLDTWKRTNVTGKGVAVLERTSNLSTSTKKSLDERLSFLARFERCLIPMAANYAKKNFQSKNEKKEVRGKTLNYEKESKEVREGLDISRTTEWNKWIQFTAGRPCRGKELAKLI